MPLKASDGDDPSQRGWTEQSQNFFEKSSKKGLTNHKACGIIKSESEKYDRATHSNERQLLTKSIGQNKRRHELCVKSR